MKNARDDSTDGIEDDSSRPAKRPRVDGAKSVEPDKEEEGPRLLPPEVWAKAANFLPCEDVISMAAVSRSMLKDVMPGIKELHITKVEQLHVGLTSRYHDVVDISVYCMLQTVDLTVAGGDEEQTLGTNDDACGRIVPFICRFPRLERVFLGGLSPNPNSARGRRRPILSFIDIPFGWLDDEEADRRDSEIARGLIRSLSGAYRCGALSSNVWVAGPSCPRSQRSSSVRFFFLDDADDTCQACIEACKSFPLASVLDFENRGSSRKSMSNGDDFFICGLDVCLSREAIEKIISERPGGKAALFSKDRLLQLLGRGERNVITPDEGKEMYVVKYHPETFEEIINVIQEGDIDVSKLNSAEVVEAIKRSFALDERDPVPPMGQCHLTESAFSDLKKLRFPITEDDFLNELNADDDPFSPSKKRAFRFH